MDEQKASALIDELVANPETMSDFREDPEAVCARMGIELDDDDRQAIAAFGGLSDQQLVERISKGGGY